MQRKEKLGGGGADRKGAGVHERAVAGVRAGPHEERPGIFPESAPLAEGIIDLVGIAGGDVVLDPRDGGPIFVPADGRTPYRVAGGHSGGGKRGQDRRRAEDAETGEREGGCRTGAQGRIEGRRRFIPDPARGIQTVAPDQLLNLRQERHDIGKGSGLKNGPGMCELHPVPVFRVMNKHLFHGVMSGKGSKRGLKSFE